MLLPATETDRLAAKLTLDALESLTPDGGSSTSGHVLLLPSLRPVGRDGAIALLAGLAKPLTCIGMHLGKTPVIGWWTEDVGASPTSEPRDLANSTLEPYRQSRVGPVSDNQFAFQSNGRIESFSFSVVERWLVDYKLALVSWNISPAHSSLAALGFVGVISVTRARGSHLNSFVEWPRHKSE